MANEEAWHTFNAGRTIHTAGSENGDIILDEEHSDGARITLEKDGYHPWAITCGIYGTMVHTAFASTESEALKKYATMKSEISKFLNRIEDSEITEEVAIGITESWCETFTNEF